MKYAPYAKYAVAAILFIVGIFSDKTVWRLLSVFAFIFLFSELYQSKKLPLHKVKWNSLLRPYSHGRWEVMIMRLLFAFSIHSAVDYMLPDLMHPYARPAGLAAFEEVSHPVGMGLFIDLTFLSDPTVGVVTHWILMVALGLYVLGVALPISAFIVFFIHCAIFTLKSSKGAIHHGYQIQSITLLAQVVVLWTPWVYRWIKKKALVLGEGRHLRDYFVYYSQLTIAAAYVIAGVTKVLRSSIYWVIDSPNVAVQIVKSHSQKYYEELDPKWADMGLPKAEWIASHPNLSRIMLGSGLLLELLAFLALINRAWALFIGISLIAMHEAIGDLMALHFPQNIQVDFIFLMNLPFWFFAGAKLVKQKLGPKSLQPT